MTDYYAALGSTQKSFHEIKGANHYFSGGGSQRAHLDEAAQTILAWTDEHHLLV